MIRTLVLVLPLLLAVPAFAEEPTPPAQAPEKAPVDHAPAAKAKKDKKAHAKPSDAKGSSQGPGKTDAAPAAKETAKPPPCEEVKPCSID